MNETLHALSQLLLSEEGRAVLSAAITSLPAASAPPPPSTIPADSHWRALPDLVACCNDASAREALSSLPTLGFSAPKLDEFVLAAGTLSESAVKADRALMARQGQLLKLAEIAAYGLHELERAGQPFGPFGDLLKGLFVAVGELTIERRVTVAKQLQWPGYLVDACRTARASASLFGDEIEGKYLYFLEMQRNIVAANPSPAPQPSKPAPKKGKRGKRGGKKADGAKSAEVAAATPKANGLAK